MTSKTRHWGRFVGTLVLAAGFLVSCQKNGPEAASQSAPAGASATDRYFAPPAPVTTPPPPAVAPTGAVEATGDDVASILIDAPTKTPAAGTGFDLAVTAVLANGKKRSITSQAAFNFSTEGLATLSTERPGGLDFKAPGKLTVTATFAGKSARIDLDIVSATFSRLEITPNDALVGANQRFYATAIFSNGTKQDVSDQVTWATSDEVHVTAVAGSPGIYRGRTPGIVTLFASFDGHDGAAPVNVRLADLSAITVTAPTTNVLFGTTLKVKATGTFKSGQTEDITEAVQWLVDDTSLATVSDASGTKGTVSAMSSGSVRVIAKFGAVTGSIMLDITAADFSSLEIEPANKPLPKGLSTRLKVFGVFADGRRQDVSADALWMSEKAYVASISNDQADSGTVTTYDVGETVATVTYGTLQVARTIKVVDPAIVELRVNPPPGSFKCGVTKPQFSATGVFSDKSESDVTEQVIWSVTDLTRGTVSNDSETAGLVTTLKAGTLEVQAEITPASTGELVKGKTTLEIGAPQLASFQLTSTKNSIAAGEVAQFDAIAVYSCAKSPPESFKTQVSWSSSDPAVSVNNTAPNQGKATVVGNITNPIITTIRATKSGINGEFELEARPKDVVGLNLTAGATEVDKGDTIQINAKATYSDGSIATITMGGNGYDIQWSSDDETVATVDNDLAKGLATGIRENRVNIRAVLTTPRAQQFVALYDLGVQSICQTGSRQGLYCWFLGAVNEDCVQTCATNSGAYIPGDIDGTGTNGSTAMCSQVLNKLGMGALNQDNKTHVEGLGCAVVETLGIQATRRFTSTPTAGTAKASNMRRVCSCSQ